MDCTNNRASVPLVRCGVICLRERGTDEKWSNGLQEHVTLVNSNIFFMGSSETKIATLFLELFITSSKQPDKPIKEGETDSDAALLPDLIHQLGSAHKWSGG